MRLGGAQGRNRTPDTRIFSPLLYRLSYLGNEEAPYLIVLTLLSQVRQVILWAEHTPRLHRAVHYLKIFPFPAEGIFETLGPSSLAVSH